MALLEPALLVVTGFCAYGALSHAADNNLPGLRRAQLLLALVCVCLVVGNIAFIRMVGTADVQQFLPAARVNQAMVAAVYLALLWFMAHYTGIAPRWLLYSLSTVFAATLLLVWLAPGLVQYAQPPQLHRAQLPWGEPWTRATGDTGPVAPVFAAALFVLIGYGAWALRRMPQRAGAGWVALGLALFALSTVLAALARLGLLDIPPPGAFVMPATLMLFSLGVQTQARAWLALNQRLIDQLPAAVYARDLAGRYMFVNRAYAQLHQVEPARLPGRTPTQLWPSGWGAGFLQRDREVLAAQRVVECEEVMAMQGREHVYLSRRFPIRLADGAVVGVAGVATDITEHKALEQALRELSASLEQQVDERTQTLRAQAVDLQQAKQRAEAAAASKSQFLANMGHEIRTPINAIVGMAWLALQAATDARQRDQLQRIERAAQHLLGILNDILDVCRFEAGGFSLQRIAFGLDAVLQDLSGALGGKAAAKGLDLRMAVAPGVPMQLLGDPQRLGQMLRHYLGNAIKFTERGSVAVQVRLLAHEGDRALVRFEVHDTGIGLSAAQTGQLFQPFSQADPSDTRRFGGTGLGLAICRQLAELMGGEVGVTSQPGQGSQFWFSAALGIAPAGAAALAPGPGDAAAHHRTRTDAGPAPAADDAASATTAARRLARLLADSDGEATDWFDTQRGLLRAAVGPRLDELGELLAAYRFDEAQQLLDGMLADTGGMAAR